MVDLMQDLDATAAGAALHWANAARVAATSFLWHQEMVGFCFGEKFS